MKTVKQLKEMIGYLQSDAVFEEYLGRLAEAGVIQVNDEDIDVAAGVVSNDFFERLAAVYGVELDAELNPLKEGENVAEHNH